MSRTTQSEIQESPVSSGKFLKWTTVKETIVVDGDEVDKIKGGTFQYFDKELGDAGEKVNLKLPFRFAVLNADYVTFKGYDEKKKRGVWSNEGAKPEHQITIKAKDENLLSFKIGDYSVDKSKDQASEKERVTKLKDAVKGTSAKYTKSVYIAVDVDGEYEIWNLQISGAALSGSPVDFNKMSAEEKKEGWLNFSNNNRSKFFSHFIEVKEFKLKKKGDSKFTIPIFEIGDEISKEDGEVLDGLDKELNKYFAYYHKPKAEKKEEEQDEPDDEQDPSKLYDEEGNELF